MSSMGQPIDVFLYLQHLVRAELREALTDLDLTPVQSTVLQLVDRSPGGSSADLARQTQVTAQTMHRIVGDLERRGLLDLQARPGHGRIREAHLTSEGREIMAAADLRAQVIEDRMTEGMTQRQRDQLLQLLRLCVRGLRASGHHASSTDHSE